MSKQKQISWAKANHSKSFLSGNPDRPITELEKALVYALAGATVLIVLIRLYQYINL